MSLISPDSISLSMKPKQNSTNNTMFPPPLSPNLNPQTEHFEDRITMIKHGGSYLATESPYSPPNSSGPPTTFEQILPLVWAQNHPNSKSKPKSQPSTSIQTISPSPISEPGHGKYLHLGSLGSASESLTTLKIVDDRKRGDVVKRTLGKVRRWVGGRKSGVLERDGSERVEAGYGERKELLGGRQGFEGEDSMQNLERETIYRTEVRKNSFDTNDEAEFSTTYHPNTGKKFRKRLPNCQIM